MVFETRVRAEIWKTYVGPQLGDTITILLLHIKSPNLFAVTVALNWEFAIDLQIPRSILQGFLLSQ